MSSKKVESTESKTLKVKRAPKKEAAVAEGAAAVATEAKKQNKKQKSASAYCDELLTFVRDHFKIDPVEFQKALNNASVPHPTDATKTVKLLKTNSTFKKSRKQKRHPDEPKGPLTSYIIFSNDVRPTLKHEDGNKKVTLDSKEISDRWNKLTSEEKMPYIKRANEDKERYNREYVEFLKKHPEIEAEKAEKAAKPAKAKKAKETSPAPAEGASLAPVAEKPKRKSKAAAAPAA